ncbi:head GIN domain-containing protein [Massilia sp. METH4]|uniref:head GIN domain-containing protein n=1 Tax=Massilia sp. METH4 TaxID=3123041 RepID=UPI0030CC2A91
MKTKSIALIATAFAAAVGLATTIPAAADSPTLAWLGGERVQGSGKIVSQARQPGPFKGVELTTGAHVEVVIGGDDTLTIEGDDNILPLVETVVENGVLNIRPVRKNMQIDGRRLKIVVRARAVDNLGVAGSGMLEARRIRADKLTLEVAGSGALDIDGIEAKTVEVGVAGSGKVDAAGQAARAQISIAGSGKADTSRLDVQHATVTVAGSGQSVLTARGSITANVTGSGNVGYYGNAQVTKAVAGSGTVQRLGASAR